MSKKQYGLIVVAALFVGFVGGEVPKSVSDATTALGRQEKPQIASTEKVVVVWSYSTKRET